MGRTFGHRLVLLRQRVQLMLEVVVSQQHLLVIPLHELVLLGNAVQLLLCPPQIALRLPEPVFQLSHLLVSSINS